MWNLPTKKQLSKIPKLYETDGKEKMIYLHFFMFDSDWFIAEYDQKDTFFGFAVLNGDWEMAEWGYISFSELKSINVKGFEVETDRHWKVQPFKQIKRR